MDHESRCLVHKKATKKCPNSKVERVPYLGSYPSNGKGNVAIRNDRARNEDSARCRKMNVVYYGHCGLLKILVYYVYNHDCANHHDNYKT